MRARLRAILVVFLAGSALPASPSPAADTPAPCPPLQWRTLQRSSLRDRMLVSHLDALLAISASEAALPKDEKSDIIVAVPDLGGDTRREMLVRLDGQAFCEASDCAIYVLRKAGNGHWSPVAELKGQEVATTGTRTNGFCDLTLRKAHGSDAWNWTGTEYQCTEPPTPVPPTPEGHFP